MQADGAEPGVLAGGCHDEPTDRALPAALIAVEQVDAECPPAGARGGDLAESAIVFVAQGALPHGEIPRSNVDVTDLPPEILRRRMVHIRLHHFRPGVPALDDRDAGADVAQGEPEVNAAIRLVDHGLGALCVHPATVAEHDLL